MGAVFSVRPEEVMDVLRKYILVDGFDVVIDMERSQGSYIVDARDGSRWVDMYTFFASSPFGMNHPRLANEEFKEKIFRAAINKVANSDIYTVEMAEFVKTFAEVALPEGFKYLFFIDYGTLAIENALKVAMDWKVRKLLSRGKITQDEANWGLRGTKVIHFKDAFHGRSGYAISMTNTADPNKYKYFAKLLWPRVLNPKIRWPLEEHLDEVVAAEKEAIKQIKDAIAANPDDICALIIETIQGEGGDNHFRGEFLRELRRICDESEIMLVFDEVQCGMGITGKMWAFEHFGVKPDIFAFGKKSQVCGIAVGPRVDEVEGHCFVESSRINSTWGGNICDMVRATRYLEIYRDEKVLDYVSEKAGPRLFEGLRSLAREFPGKVLNVRGRGLMCAFDLPTPADRDAVIKKMWEKRMLILKSGTQGIRFRPALDVPLEAIDEAIEISRAALKEVFG